ncbi:MAG: polyprenyl synthetase family protein [Rikenellaceae bacterium]
MIELSDIQTPVRENIEHFSKVFNSSLSSDIELINKMSNYVLTMQGKQMRPLFLLLSSALHGGVTTQSYYAATFIELVHTASLIHDDVVDEAYMRRDKLSVNALERSKVAVLLGDYVLSRGLRIAVQHELYKTIGMMASVIEQMSMGELLQTQHTIKLDITDVIRRKTAVLMATCGAAGATCANGSQDDIDRMYKFGELLGTAFQIKDDILDYTKTSKTGKITCNDIKERKLTLPIIAILEKSNNKEKRALLSMIRDISSSSKSVEAVRNYVIQHGGIAQAESKMEQIKQEAISVLDFYADSDIKTALINYADFVLNRTK